MKNGKPASFEDLRDELRIANRLRILALVRSGIQQKEIAATIGASESTLSEMFPTGLLRRVARLAQMSTTGVDV